MTTLQQKTSFGPGVYRGHKFDKERLRSFVEGTNKAIAAGIPIPLLKRHAPIDAGDSETTQFADAEGSGWVKRVFMDDEGCIGFEAECVDPKDAADVESGKLRFTSPEFRPFYRSEKAGVYQGPVIRHFAFTPKPGNPHQSAMTLAMSEQSWQFAEEERQPFSLDRSDESFDGSMEKPEHDDPNKLGVGSEGKSIDTEELASDEEWYTDEAGKKLKRKKTTAQEKKDDTNMPQATPDKLNIDIVPSQHAERTDETPDDKETGKKDIPEATDDPAKVGGVVDIVEPESPPMKDATVENPDMPPPKATDKTKLAAVLAGFNQKGLVLPSDFTFEAEGAIDILLAALNSSIKAENDKEAEEAKDEEESPPVNEAAMPFSEGGSSQHVGSTTHLHHQLLKDHGYKLKHKSERRYIYGHNDGHSADVYPDGKWSHYERHSGGDAKTGKDHRDLSMHLSDLHGSGVQYSEQFSEQELNALPEKVRKVVEAGQKALAEERKAKEKAQQEAIQFAEQERATKNNAARDKAKGVIEKSKLPPVLKKQLLGAYDGEKAIQFSEGEEERRYTASEVATMVANALPPTLQFLEGEAVDATAPKAGKTVIGPDGKPLVIQPTTEQFFEMDEIPSNHVSPERARELVQSSPYFKNNHVKSNAPLPTIGGMVAAENERVPNRVMRP